MKRRRILVLFNENLVPPEDKSEVGERLGEVWSSFELVAALRELGHHVHVLGVHDELAPIRDSIAEHEPHVVFNQLLDFHGAALYDAHVVSYLELLKTPYTGCNPRGILLSSDKALSKKILTYHRIRVPRFALVPRAKKPLRPKGMHYPMFVKSAVEHGSVGIAQASIVHNDDQLARRVEFVHDSVGSDAMVEQYVEGREITVSLFGNQRITALPAWELFFGELPEGTAPIATARVKWSQTYQKKLDIRNGPAELDDAKTREVVRIAKRVYKVLGLSGYGRVDLRLDAEGRVYVLEANPNPDLTPGEDFAASAEHVELGYPELLQRILSLGLAYRPGWKAGD